MKILTCALESFTTRSASCTCAPAACAAGQPASSPGRLLVALIAVLMLGVHLAVAGPQPTTADFEKLIPADKGLDPDWLKSLTQRGTRQQYRGKELEKIGMPIGGLCAGQLYLGGDGKLWLWDIFNHPLHTGDRHYAHPPAATSPLEQGFAVRISSPAEVQLRTLDSCGWAQVSFIGEYPIGYVTYTDPETPIQVGLEAFSPFIPLNAEDSALPATVLRFRLHNTGNDVVDVELGGWLENAVCCHTAQPGQGLRANTIRRSDRLVMVECSAHPPPVPAVQQRPDILFEDFEKETYLGWTVTGTAFGPGPIEKSTMPAYQGDIGAIGKRLVNSHNVRSGEDVRAGDGHVGTLTSSPFTISRAYISFLVGGGAHKQRTCVNLLVEDKVVLSATGANDNRMKWHTWDVRQWEGKTARIQIVDAEKGPWGNIGIDHIVFSDRPSPVTAPLEQQYDFGTMCLALLDPQPTDKAVAAIAEPDVPSSLFAQPATPAGGTAQKPFGTKHIAGLVRSVQLRPGQSATVCFVLSWHFPNLAIPGLGLHGGRWYGTRWSGAAAVAHYLAENLERLSYLTRLWHDTWYDSTLPYWFLDRTFLNTSTLATNTCYWLGNGRFYAWEGVGCCAGTCTHVWHYAQAPARLFPVFERSLREMVDFGVAFDPATGRIRFRAEHNNHWAVDGQAGCILRTYREHQMSADESFLRRVWPRAKKALEFLIVADGNGDGVLEGPQHNTLDADWYGQVAWLTGMYLAALRAGEEMAMEMGDEFFARRCREIFQKGSRYVDEALFNGQYYSHLPDPQHKNKVGSYDGCHIDQVLGQSWAFQVGLGRILREDNVHSALRSLWKYNFTKDVGPYRAVHKPGRWYAMPGEGGLLMCTWPRGEQSRVRQHFDYYFNECMTGFEYQVAAHMIAEGMVQEGLAVTRTIHDRYHPTRRNPWNEVECGDHYARAMASYGVFLAACGYEYHGPKGRLGFFPRISPENFRAALTAAEGWGTYWQRTEGGKLAAGIELHYGRLRLKTLRLGPLPKPAPQAVGLQLEGKPVAARMAAADGQRAELQLTEPLTIEAGQRLAIELR